MPFDSKSASEAGKRSKRGPVKKELPSIKEKMEMLYEKVLDDLLVNQDKLTKTERDKFTLEQLKEMSNQSWMDKDPDPTK